MFSKRVCQIFLTIAKNTVKRVLRGKRLFFVSLKQTFNEYLQQTCNEYLQQTYNEYFSWKTGEHHGWRTEEHLSWRTGEHLHVLYLFHVLQTYSMFSNPGLQDSNEGLADILLFWENIHLVPKMKWAKRTKWIARISLQSWQRSRNNNGDWFTFSLCQKV